MLLLEVCRPLATHILALKYGRQPLHVPTQPVPVPRASLWSERVLSFPKVPLPTMSLEMMWQQHSPLSPTYNGWMMRLPPSQLLPMTVQGWGVNPHAVSNTLNYIQCQEQRKRNAYDQRVRDVKCSSWPSL
jgi:hypothetical protein